ncbi:MAG: S8 family serine peptidase [Ignavibacteriales bacterium]|nr:S8 family serine peptidase [Ignavibacteriales bacterium]
MNDTRTWSGKIILLGLLSFLVIVVIAGCSKTEAPTQSVGTQQITPLEKVGYDGTRLEFVPGEVIVKFKTGVADVKRNAAFGSVNGKLNKNIITAAMKKAGDNEGITVINTTMPVRDAVNALKNSPDVVYAEPNYYYYHDATSNDTYYTNGSLWGMYGDATTPANQYGSQAGEAWAAGHTGLSTVFVGEIDEGIMFTHTDLAGQIWTNPYDPVDGIDNDGNGYIDDIHGWDFDGNNNTIYDGPADDHGTHVAGTIGAKGGNALGVVGVCWNIQIISGKFLGKTGGTTTNAILALDYFTDLKSRHGLNIVATNNSWGGGAFSQALQDAIERSNQANILFVAAAGNDGSNTDATASYPSCYPNANIIAVASITSTGTLSSFSNYGLTTVDLGAPGSAIYSTIPSKSGAASYASYSGTSMATPHVTGGVALYAAYHPGSTAATIKSAVLASVVPTTSLSGKCVTGGRLNVSGF